MAIGCNAEKITLVFYSGFVYYYRNVQKGNFIMLATITEFKKLASEERFTIFRLGEVEDRFHITGYTDRMPDKFELENPNRSRLAVTLRITRPTDFNTKAQRSFTSLDKAFAFVKSLADSVPVVIIPKDCTDATCHEESD